MLSAALDMAAETVEYLSDPDTNGAVESVIVSEVSSIQRLKRMQEWYNILGVGKGVLFREVSLSVLIKVVCTVLYAFLSSTKDAMCPSSRHP